jgi:C4-type Zn-finger protein
MSENQDIPDPNNGTPQEQSVMGFTPIAWINGILRKTTDVVNEVLSDSPQNEHLRKLREMRKALAELAAVSAHLTDSEGKLQEIEKILAVDQVLEQTSEAEKKRRTGEQYKDASISKAKILKSVRERLRGKQAQADARKAKAKVEAKTSRDGKPPARRSRRRKNRR